MRYDLSTLRQTDRRTKLYQAPVLSAFVVLCVVVAGLVGYRVVLSATGLGDGLTPLDFCLALLALSVAAFGAYVTAVQIPTFLSGADSVELTAEGIRLRYRIGGEDMVRWHDRTSRVLIKDFSEVPGPVIPGTTYSIERKPGAQVFSLHHRQTWLTPEAFQAILATATSEGFKVSSRRLTSFVLGGSYKTYLIGGGDAADGGLSGRRPE